DRNVTGVQTCALPIYDFHFKKAFFYRFVNRQINRQTIESFRFELISTFLTYQEHINKVYEDLEKYIQGVSESKTISDTHSDDSRSEERRVGKDSRVRR